jgi:hypothetical protein
MLRGAESGVLYYMRYFFIDDDAGNNEMVLI